MKNVLTFDAVADAATGMALLIVPSLVGRLLFGEERRRKGSEAVVGPMPPFGEIIRSDDDLWKIIAWIRSVYCGRRAAGC